jgi:hypothetical protein
MRNDGKRIEDVLDQHLPRVADRRQVVDRVPFTEQRHIVEQLVALSVRQYDVQRGRAVDQHLLKYVPINRRRATRRHCCVGTVSPLLGRFCCGAVTAAEATALQVHHQQRDRGRRHTRDARGLADRFGAELVELLTHLERQTANLTVVDTIRQAGILVRIIALDLVGLALDITLILDTDLDLLLDLPSSTGSSASGSAGHIHRPSAHIRRRS